MFSTGLSSKLGTWSVRNNRNERHLSGEGGQVEQKESSRKTPAELYPWHEWRGRDRLEGVHHHRQLLSCATFPVPWSNCQRATSQDAVNLWHVHQAPLYATVVYRMKSPHRAARKDRPRFSWTSFLRRRHGWLTLSSLKRFWFIWSCGIWEFSYNRFQEAGVLLGHGATLGRVLE